MWKCSFTAYTIRDIHVLLLGPAGMEGTCVCQETEVVVADTQGQIPASQPAQSYGGQAEAAPIERHAQGGYQSPGVSPDNYGSSDSSSRGGYNY